nr:hypothetical protein [Nitrosopumilus sp.]
MDTLKLTSLFPWVGEPASRAKDALAQKLFNQAVELKHGQSMWVDMSSIPGQHSIKGRIERTEKGEYLFQMSNTGTGVPEHSNWHKQEYFQNSNFYQTVVQWGPFDTPDTFSKEFFYDLLNACLDGKVPAGVEMEKIDGKGEYGEDLQAVDAIYKTLGNHLKKPADLPINEYPSYWSTLQEGPSCVPNSIWALIRVSLSENEYQDLRTEIQLHNLKHLYNAILSGNDRTDYTLIRALEQVKTLIVNAESKGKGKAAPVLLKNIQSDLENRASDRKIKVKIINSNPRLISDFSTEVELKLGRLKRLPGALKAEVVYESLLISHPNSHNDATKIKIERNAQGEPTGASTLAFLLYDALLRDNDEEVATKLKDFVGFMDKIEDPSSITVDKGELLALTKMFYMLSWDFRKVDGTLQSRPKQLALANISQALYTLLYAQCCKENQNPFAVNSAISLAGLDVFSDLNALTKEALTFSSLAPKTKQDGHELNIWYDQDHKIQIFHNKNKWNAYSDRIIIDASIEEKRLDQLDQGVGIRQVQFSLLTETPKTFSDVPLLKEKNAVQALSFYQPLDKITKKHVDISKINVAYAPIYDKSLPEIEIAIVDNKPVAS